MREVLGWCCPDDLGDRLLAFQCASEGDRGPVWRCRFGLHLAPPPTDPSSLGGRVDPEQFPEPGRPRPGLGLLYVFQKLAHKAGGVGEGRLWPQMRMDRHPDPTTEQSPREAHQVRFEDAVATTEVVGRATFDRDRRDEDWSARLRIDVNRTCVHTVIGPVWDARHVRGRKAEAPTALDAGLHDPFDLDWWRHQSPCHRLRHPVERVGVGPHSAGFTLVEGGDRFHVGWVKLKVEDFDVLLEPLDPGRLGKDDVPARDVPAEH